MGDYQVQLPFLSGSACKALAEKVLANEQQREKIVQDCDDGALDH